MLYEGIQKLYGKIFMKSSILSIQPNSINLHQLHVCLKYYNTVENLLDLFLKYLKIIESQFSI